MLVDLKQILGILSFLWFFLVGGRIDTIFPGSNNFATNLKGQFLPCYTLKSVFLCQCVKMCVCVCVFHYFLTGLSALVFML